MAEDRYVVVLAFVADDENLGEIISEAAHTHGVDSILCRAEKRLDLTLTAALRGVYSPDGVKSLQRQLLRDRNGATDDKA